MTDNVKKRKIWIFLRYLVMVLFLGHEYSVSRLVNMHWYNTDVWVKLIYFFSLAFLILIVSFGIVSKNLKAPTPRVIKRFFSNAIGSDPYTLILLVFFLLNLNWLSNATFKLVADREINGIAVTEMLYLSLPPLFAIVTSWFLFPSSTRTSDKYLLFTGLSLNRNTLTLRNIDALVTPIVKSNLNIDKLIIVPSNTTPSPAPSFNDFMQINSDHSDTKNDSISSQEKPNLFTNTESDSILVKEGEGMLKRKRFQERRPRKENQDNIRKKIKRGFFNCALIKKLNEKLKGIFKC